MLKLESNLGTTNIKIKGNVITTVADICVGIQAIYNALKGNNPHDAEVFKVHIIRCILEGKVMR